MPKLYVVSLKPCERQELQRRVRAGRESARVLARARVLLKCDDGLADEEAAEAVGVSVGTVERVRKRFCTAPGSTGPCRTARSRRGRTSARSTGRRRPGWSRWPARRLRTGGRVGRWSRWRTRWRGCGTSAARSAGRRCGGR